MAQAHSKQSGAPSDVGSQGSQNTYVCVCMCIHADAMQAASQPGCMQIMQHTAAIKMCSQKDETRNEDRGGLWSALKGYCLHVTELSTTSSKHDTCKGAEPCAYVEASEAGRALRRTHRLGRQLDSDLRSASLLVHELG